MLEVVALASVGEHPRQSQGVAARRCLACQTFGHHAYHEPHFTVPATPHILQPCGYERVRRVETHSTQVTISTCDCFSRDIQLTCINFERFGSITPLYPSGIWWSGAVWSTNNPIPGQTRSLQSLWKQCQLQCVTGLARWWRTNFILLWPASKANMFQAKGLKRTTESAARIS
jgi:hypothetical protein